MAHIFGSIWDRFNRNALNDLSKNVEVQGKSIQDLVAEGQLTPGQYANLIQTVNDLVKSGQIDRSDLSLSLKTELDEFDSQLAETAKESEVQNSLNLKRDKSTLIPLADLGQDAKEAMTGGSVAVVGVDAVTTTNVRDGAITPRKLSGVKTTSDNLINRDDLIYGGYIASDGEVVEGTSVSGMDCYTPHIEVDADLLLFKNSNSLVYWYDVDKNNIGAVGLGSLSFTLPPNAKYIRASYSSIESNYYVSFSNKYTPYKYEIDGLETPIGEKSITWTNTDFITLGKNKVMPVILDGMSISAGNGQLIETTTPNTFSFIAEIENGKTYTVSKSRAGNRFRIALVKEYPHPGTMPVFSSQYHVGENTIEAQEHTFVNNVNAKYAVILTNSNYTNTPLLQVEEGDVATEYEVFSAKIYNEEVSSPKKINFDEYVSSGKNKFDGTFLEGMILGVSPESVLPAFYNTSRCAIVRLEKDKTYTIKKYVGGDRLRFGIVDQYPTKDNLPLPTLYHHVADNAGEEYTLTIKNEYGDKPLNYLVIHTNTNATDLPLIQVEEGTEATIYEDYKINLLGKELNLDDEKHYILDDIQGIYSSPTDLPSVAIGEPTSLISTVHGDIYNLYDELVVGNPSYITKTGLGTDLDGNNINQYKLIPTSADSDMKPKRPKLIILSGLHGNEKAAVWSLYQFVKDLCDNWSNNSILEFIRWNFELVVVPMCNPSGYDLNQRKNSNGVDLNRNFPTDEWTLMSDPDSVNYGGSTPASEVETQILVDLFTRNIDAEYMIDCHNFATHSGYLMWCPTRSPENKRLMSNVMSTMSRKWKREHSQLPQDDSILGYISTTTSPSSNSYGYSLGFKSMTLECVNEVQFGEGTRRNDVTTIQCGIDLIGNTLVGIGKSIK